MPTLTAPTPSPSLDNNSEVKTASRASYRVLIIEDDRHISRLISVNLMRVGVEAHSAYDGISGLEAFGNHPPHLVLLDLMMPGLNGFQVCESLRKKSAVPIIIMTARIEPIHQMRGFRLGADDFVLKPFDPQLLVARVIAHLRRVYRYGNGNIARKDTFEFDSNETEHDLPQTQHDASSILSHMPEGWAGCDFCHYMAPLSQFPRYYNGHGASALSCPHCKKQGQIRFAVSET